MGFMNRAFHYNNHCEYKYSTIHLSRTLDSTNRSFDHKDLSLNFLHHNDNDTKILTTRKTFWSF